MAYPPVLLIAVLFLHLCLTLAATALTLALVAERHLPWLLGLAVLGALLFGLYRHEASSGMVDDLGEKKDYRLEAELAYGASPNARMEDGTPALVWAAGSTTSGSSPESLLRAGAQPWLRDRGGMNAESAALSVGFAYQAGQLRDERRRGWTGLRLWAALLDDLELIAGCVLAAAWRRRRAARPVPASRQSAVPAPGLTVRQSGVLLALPLSLVTLPAAVALLYAVERRFDDHHDSGSWGVYVLPWVCFFLVEMGGIALVTACARRFQRKGRGSRLPAGPLPVSGRWGVYGAPLLLTAGVVAGAVLHWFPDPGWSVLLLMAAGLHWLAFCTPALLLPAGRRRAS